MLTEHDIIKKQTMKRNSKKMQHGIIAAIIAAALAIVGLIVCFSGFGNERQVHLYVDQDDNADSILQKLQVQCSPNLLAFRVNATVFGIDKKARTGHYIISDNLSVMKLLHRIRNHNEDPVPLIVPSVRTIDEMVLRLSQQIMSDSADIRSALSNSSTIRSLGYTSETLPCLFIPNTYEIYWDITPEALVERLVKENYLFWNEQRTSKLSGVSQYAGEEMTKEKVITLASIIDSETANNAEKPIIASLYMNRMRIGMPLQSDPTVKFALGDFSLRRIMHKHLNVQSPYNTYRNKGLPPGPICIPSIAGIDAVLNHATNDYIYMCAKEDFSGTHNYAVSYAEHQRNAARYAKALNQRNIH